MNNEPRVTIVIPNWNGSELLEKCLESIERNTRYDNHKLVIVDNGSTDGSIKIIENSNIDAEIIKNDKNRGYITANNQAFEQYPHTEYYLLLNNDTVICQNGWLEELVKYAQKNDSDILGCKLLYPSGELQHGGGIIGPGWPPAAQISINSDVQKGQENSFWCPDYVTGAAMLVQENVISHFDGFDGIFNTAYYEDTDLCVQADRAGFSVHYTPNVEIIHHEKASTETKPLFWFENQLKFILLNFPVRWLLIQIVYQFRGLLGHLYHRRDLFSIYAPVIKDLKKIIKRRISRAKTGKER
jgi:GT2 family glycosyltransferase